MKILFMAIYLITLTIFSSPIGKWSNKQQKLSIEFKKNGKFIWRVGNNTIKGTWKQINKQVIQTYANNQITQYGFMVKNNMLGLVAKNGAQIYLTKINTKVKVNTKYNNTLTDSQFMYLLKNYARMHPNTVYTYLTKFSKSQRSWIPIYTAWYNLMVFRACQGTLAYNNQQDKQMCYNSKLRYQKDLNLYKSLSMKGDPLEYGRSQTQKLLIFYKCKYGLIDKGSCNMYVGVQKNINKMHNEISKEIIKGFEPLPCVKHYEDNNGSRVYLGCW